MPVKKPTMSDRGRSSRTRTRVGNNYKGYTIVPTPFTIHVYSSAGQPKVICKYPKERKDLEQALNLAFFEAFLDLNYFDPDIEDFADLEDTDGPNGQYSSGATWFDHDENSFAKLVSAVQIFLKREGFKYKKMLLGGIKFLISETNNVTMIDKIGVWRYPKKRFCSVQPKGGIFDSPKKLSPSKKSSRRRRRR